ncbi:MAG: AAA family ATPase [Alphaproteobacteria bacterium]|nr:AAA family ATPase [Alphaproteobacteria bacterium]NCQ89205.1 AAA family ATPase [Alphaproteobacteria bacterium]NCT08119.1 AAA family ATPase [Alphaproteobacteria bacterium]
MTTETSILLPEARVDLFIKDKETIEAARSLQNDWRFARVTISIEEGDVESAISAYTQASSPTLVLLETDVTDDSFVGRLEALSAYCNEGTNAIVIGPVNDINLYRHLTSIGVSDYLVKPVPLATLAEIIAQSLIEKLGAVGSRMIATIGSKGGVGTSALTQALALGISENLDQKTFFMDAAGGWTSMPVGMGFEPTTNLHEAVKAAASKDFDVLDRMLFKPNEKLSVLAAGSEAMLEPSVQAAQYEELIDMVMASYPVVLIDLSGAIPSLKRMVMNRAHEIMIVATPTLSSLRAARTLMQEVKVLHGGSISNIDLVINMEGLMPSKEVSKKDIADVLEIKPSVTIPFDPKLFLTTENEGKKMNQEKAGRELIERLLPVAQSVLSSVPLAVKGDALDLGVIGSFLSKIKKG